MRITRRGYFSRPCSAALMLAVVSAPFLPHGAVLRARAENPPKFAAAPAVRQSAPAVTARHSAVPKAVAKKTVAVAPPAASTHADVFRGLGAWVDLYDFSLDPVRTVQRLKANGVATLYIQTGRTDTRRGLDPRSWRWVMAAHSANIKVVGWYLPYYSNMKRDFARTLAIGKMTFRGHRFDGVGIDIEYKGALGGKRWNRRVVQLEAAVRRALGPTYPIAAIVPPPMQMWLAPRTWAGFPWKALAKSSDAMLLMSYWTDRVGCPAIRRHCAFEFTDFNVRLTRKMIARPGVMVHIIGGIGNVTSLAQTRAFVRGVLASKAEGASFYDVATTTRSTWPILRQLSSLNPR